MAEGELVSLITHPSHLYLQAYDEVFSGERSYHSRVDFLVLAHRLLLLTGVNDERVSSSSLFHEHL